MPAVTDTERLAAAIELERARDDARIANLAGVATRVDMQRVRTADRAWDVASGRTTAPQQRGRS